MWHYALVDVESCPHLCLLPHARHQSDVFLSCRVVLLTHRSAWSVCMCTVCMFVGCILDGTPSALSTKNKSSYYSFGTSNEIEQYRLKYWIGCEFEMHLNINGEVLEICLKSMIG